MSPPVNRTEDHNAFSEDRFRDQLINHVVLLCSAVAVVIFALTQVRALQIGWSARDLIYLIILICTLAVALCRRKLGARLKSATIVTLTLSAGAAGVGTLGMLSGGVFFLPFSVIIMALFYSKRAVVVSGILSVVFLCFIAAGFVSGRMKLDPDADFLLASSKHWSVYIIAFAFVVLVTCGAILYYRRGIGDLIASISYQREELEKSNKKLQGALDEIRTLRGILPLCSFCSKIRNDEGCWEHVDVYIRDHSEAEVSHGICPECMKKHYPTVHVP